MTAANSGIDQGQGRKPNKIKEHFVVTSLDGQLFHFTVEGSIVRHGARIPQDPSVPSSTCMAWKGECILTGDHQGGLHVWDLKSRSSRTIPTSHSTPVREIAFAPGRAHTKAIVRFQDGIDIWDLASGEAITVSKDSKTVVKEGGSVVSVSWAASDRPVLLLADGTR